MQWNATSYAGFSTVVPWLHCQMIFAAERGHLDADAQSISPLQGADRLRKKCRCLILSGDYVPVTAQGICCFTADKAIASQS